MDYKEKIVLITGASYGIGRAIVYFFANLNCKLIITYNESQDLSNNLINDIKNKFNVEIENVKCDLRSESDIENLFQLVNEKYGKVDILINNAALSKDSYIFDKTKEEFMGVLEVNLVGTFLMIKYFHQITDYIFNISSTDGIETGNSYNIDYSCSKAGINMMTKYLSIFDNKTKYIAICPNWVDTEPIREMNQDFLNSELKRINQTKLINPITIAKVIKECIDNDISSGSIRIIEGDIGE